MVRIITNEDLYLESAELALNAFNTGNVEEGKAYLKALIIEIRENLLDGNIYSNNVHRAAINRLTKLIPSKVND